jgi:hypothetical protein
VGLIDCLCVALAAAACCAAVLLVTVVWVAIWGVRLGVASLYVPAL